MAVNLSKMLYMKLVLGLPALVLRIVPFVLCVLTTLHSVWRVTKHRISGAFVSFWMIWIVPPSYTAGSRSISSVVLYPKNRESHPCPLQCTMSE